MVLVIIAVLCWSEQKRQEKKKGEVKTEIKIDAHWLQNSVQIPHCAQCVP